MLGITSLLSSNKVLRILLQKLRHSLQQLQETVHAISRARYLIRTRDVQSRTPCKKGKISNRPKVQVLPTRTIYSWIKRYRETLTFLRLRKKFDVHPDNVITTQRFDHLQVYPFKYHSLKMHLAAKEFPQISKVASWEIKGWNPCDPALHKLGGTFFAWRDVPKRS